MFLLINNEDLHKVNKRIIFNITNDGDVNLLMSNVKNGDVVELELTELATNTLHYVLASHKTFVKDVPYSFEFSPYLGVNTLSGTKNLVDFKLNKVIVKIEHDRYAPSIDHYLIVGEDDDQNGLVNVDGVPNLELKPLRDARAEKLDYVSDKRVLHKHGGCPGHHHDLPAQYHNAPHTAYPNYDLLPQYQHCLAHHRPLTKPRPTKVIKLSREAHAQILKMLSEFRYVLPSGGCVLPIINPDLLVNKDYLEEYVKHELSHLVTIDILSTRIESALKSSDILKTVSETVYGLVIDKIAENGLDPEMLKKYVSKDELEEIDIYTKTEVDDMVTAIRTNVNENKVRIDTLNGSLHSLSTEVISDSIKVDVKLADLRDELTKVDIYTKSEVDAMIHLLETQLEELKRNKEDILTKEEIDELLKDEDDVTDTDPNAPVVDPGEEKLPDVDEEGKQQPDEENVDEPEVQDEPTDDAEKTSDRDTGEQVDEQEETGEITTEDNGDDEVPVDENTTNEEDPGNGGII